MSFSRFKIRRASGYFCLSPVEDEEALCGTLGVAIHAACGLQQPACMFLNIWHVPEQTHSRGINWRRLLSLSGVYVCVEVDGYEFHDRRAQTHTSVHSLDPHWDQVRVGKLTERVFFKTSSCLDSIRHLSLQSNSGDLKVDAAAR